MSGSSPRASATTSAYTVARALARDYAVEERMTLSVRAKLGDEVVYESWALNEATVEKAERERMLEVSSRSTGVRSRRSAATAS
jgi:NAD kinase